MTESGPGSAGSDEPYVLFFVGNLATGEAVVKRTTIFDDVDSSESRWETVRLWGPNDTAAAFPEDTPDKLVILVQAMEHDDCDVEEERSTMESWLHSRLGQYLQQGLTRDTIVARLYTDMAIAAQCSAKDWWGSEDEVIGSPVELRITATDVLTANSGTTVNKTLNHDEYDGDAYYRTMFRLKASGGVLAQ